MSPPTVALPDEELEAALRDLGRHLDVGPAGTAPGNVELVTSILGRIAAADTKPRERRTQRRSRLLVAAAAVVVVAIAGLLTVTPTREAIANWLGIGAVRIATSDAPPTTNGRLDPPTSVDLDAAARAVPFSIRVADPAVAGTPLTVTVDHAVPSGLVEIGYEGFTLVQVASTASQAPALEKIVGPRTTITSVTVGDRPGFWLTGEPHALAYVRPDGETALDTVRRAGDVLLWEDGGVTYRIEGVDSLDSGLAIASSLR